MHSITIRNFLQIRLQQRLLAGCPLKPIPPSFVVMELLSFSGSVSTFQQVLYLPASLVAKYDQVTKSDQWIGTKVCSFWVLSLDSRALICPLFAFLPACTEIHWLVIHLGPCWRSNSPGKAEPVSHPCFCDKYPDSACWVNAHLTRLSAERWPWACSSSFHMTYHAHTWTLKLTTQLTPFACTVAQPTFRAHRWGHPRVSSTHFLYPLQQSSSPSAFAFETPLTFIFFYLCEYLTF